ncbi:KRR1 interacting protein 1 [Pseudohyphozyma bogoriensis]|nr:KRR1 interacting protein 1 [Pseudohyphozyma bogoriensis]
MPALYSDSEDEGSVPTFGVNKEFATKYETKKRTEELSKLQDKYGADYTLSDEEDSEDLSDDDSDAELVTPAVDVAILRTLAMIKSKDPSVYEGGRQVFDEEELRHAGVSTSKQSTKTKASKPVLLKDYQRARLIADPTGDSQADQPSASDFLPTFAQEERALRAETKRAFLGGGSDEEEEDDLLVPREKTQDEAEREEKDYQKFLKENVGVKEVDAALEDEEKFLKDYILNRGWIDRSSDKSRIPSYNEVTGDSDASKPKKEKKKKEKKASDVVDAEEEDVDAKPDPGAHDSEDSEFEEVAEEFEHKYNFRFEEAEGATLTTHSRDMGKSVRKATTAVTARQRQRELAKERKEEEKAERREEVRRLKALKRKEVEEKLLKIVEAAGEGTMGIDGIDLEGDWDPEEHDRKMAEVYGQDYEGADDADFKPTWDDDIDISDLIGDGDEDGSRGDEAFDPSEVQGKKKKKDKKGKRKRDEEGFPSELMEAAKRTGNAQQQAELEKLEDEYYGLDHEDKVGDVNTRFNYAKVAPSAYSLTPVEILMATDAELNAYMSLRKMAPYRQGEEKPRSKKKLKEFRDALKNREWGVEIDEEAEERQKKRPKWSEEGAKKREKKEGSSTDAKGKRMGKKERTRKKLEAEAAAAAAGGEGAGASAE